MQWLIFFFTAGSIVAVGVLYYLGRRTHSKLQGINGGGLTEALQAASHHEARAGELKEQINKVTKERDDLHLEVARLNQHIIDLLGSTIVDLKLRADAEERRAQERQRLHELKYGV